MEDDRFPDLETDLNEALDAEQPLSHKKPAKTRPHAKPQTEWWQAKLDSLWEENRRLDKENAGLRIELATLRALARRGRLAAAASLACVSLGSIWLGAAPSYLSIAGARDVGIVIVVVAFIMLAMGTIIQVILDKASA